MDSFDQLIIEELRSDARQSVSSIADKVHLSRTAVTERIKKLESDGVICGYQAIIKDPNKSSVKAYFEITYKDKSCSEIAHSFHKIPEVVSCHGISGNIDLLVFISAQSMQRLHEIREQMDKLPEIDSLKTHIVLSEWLS